jgi:hypothetical protein
VKKKAKRTSRKRHVNPGRVDTPQNLNLVKDLIDSMEAFHASYLSISDRINEGNERLRVIEGDIERIQFYIGRLSARNT